MFQLWGNNDLYVLGLLDNLSKIDKYYRGWIPVIYIEKSLKVKLPDHAIVFRMADQGIFNWCWRLNIFDDVKFDRAIFRDCDSRLNIKEKACVNNWVDSDKNAYISHDHPKHSAAIMAGMWGIKGGIITDVKEALNTWASKNPQLLNYGVDQFFLHHWVLPQIRGNICRFGGRFGFPCKHIDVGEHIGQKICPQTNCGPS